MNPDILTQVRVLLAAIAGFFVGKGWITSEIASALVGLVILAIPSIWGWLSNRPTSKEAVKIAERVAISDAPEAASVTMSSVPPPGQADRRMF